MVLAHPSQKEKEDLEEVSTEIELVDEDQKVPSVARSLYVQAIEILMCTQIQNW